VTRPSALKSALHGAVKAWFGVACLVGSLHLFNLLEAVEGAATLSSSIHFVAGWWRYWTSLPFHWLKLRIDPMARDLIVLVLIAISVSNVHQVVENGRSLFSLVFGPGRDASFERWVRRLIARRIRQPNRRTNYRSIWTQHRRRIVELAWQVGFQAVGFIFVAVILLRTYPWLLILLVWPVLLAPLMAWAEKHVPDGGLPWQAVFPALFLVLPCVPSGLLAALFSAMASSRKAIALTAGLCLLMLIADGVFRTIGDPLLVSLQHLPSPPAPA